MEEIMDNKNTNAEEQQKFLEVMNALVELSKKNDNIDFGFISDIENLNKYNDFIKNTQSIKFGKIVNKDKEYSRCRCAVTDNHFHNRLIELGCTPQKSLTLKFPDESIFKSKDLIRHFIRGYFDGDGCFS